MPDPPGIDLTGVDLPTEVVRTERLVLRPGRPEDVDDLLRAWADPELQRWLTFPVPFGRTDAEATVARIAEARTAGRALLNLVEAGGRLVGSAGLHFPVPSLFGPAVGYWTAPWARGQGYAAEAAAALTAWAFAHGAHRVHLLADVGNLPSQQVARRAGFSEEGRVRACLPYRDGRYGDAVLFGRPAS
jgi:RimJ/RimL family protein N-acetyltransferase